MQSPLDSLTHLFHADASNARLEHMLATMEKIETSSISSENDPGASFAAKQRVFRSGLDAWLESLTVLTDKCAQQLQNIAGFYPNLVGTNPDPAQWVRSRLEQLLEKTLGHKLSAPSLASPPRTPSPPGESLYLSWFLNVCDGMPDFDTYPDSGRPSLWCAPAWCWTHLTARSWVRRGKPERLDFDLTEKVIRSVQRLFTMRLSYVLDQVEHRVRVEFASRGQLASSRQHSAAGGVSRSSSRSHVAPAGDAKRDQGVKAAMSLPSTAEKVLFSRRKGETVADLNFTDQALLNSYESFAETLRQVRTLVMANDGELPINELRHKFGQTALGKAADDKAWAEWIAIFGERTPAKAAALLFLEKKTGLNRSTIKKRCSSGRKRREVTTPASW
jgi:hypothetical protein